MAGKDLEEELQYSRSLIDANFSNYSAWHARSAILRAQQSQDQVVSMEDLVAGNQTGKQLIVWAVSSASLQQTDEEPIVSPAYPAVLPY